MLGTRGWNSRSETHHGIKTSSMAFEVVAVVVRQCALNSLLADGFGFRMRRSDHEEWSFLLFLL